MTRFAEVISFAKGIVGCGVGWHIYQAYSGDINSESTSTSFPKMIYLDQSVYSTLLSSSRDWKSTSLGKILVDARNSGLGQVWAGPTHVIELIQAEDKGLRRSLGG